MLDNTPFINDLPALFDVPATGTKQSRRKSASLDKIKVNHELAKDRYYFHRRLKGTFPIDAAKRLIDVTPYKSFEEIPIGPRYYVGQLIELGYNIQLQIL